MNFAFTPFIDFQEHTTLLGHFASRLAWGDKERPGEWNSGGHSHNYEKAKQLQQLVKSIYDQHGQEIAKVEAKRAELDAIEPLTDDDAHWKASLLSSIDAKIEAMKAEHEIRDRIADRAQYLRSCYENSVYQWMNNGQGPYAERDAALSEAAVKWHPAWQDHWNVLVLHFHELKAHMIQHLAIYPWAPEVYAYLEQTGVSKDYAPDSSSNPLMKQYDPCISCIEADIAAFKKGVLAANFQLPVAVCQGRTFQAVDASYGSKGIVRWEWSFHAKKTIRKTSKSGTPFEVNTKKVKPGKYEVRLKVTDGVGNTDEKDGVEIEVCKPKANCRCCLDERAKDDALDEVLEVLESIAQPLVAFSQSAVYYSQAVSHYLSGKGTYQRLPDELVTELAADYRDTFVVQPYLAVRKILHGEIAHQLLVRTKKKQKPGAGDSFELVVERDVLFPNLGSYKELAAKYPLFGPCVHARATIRAEVQTSEAPVAAVQCTLTRLRLHVVDNMDFALTAEKFVPVFEPIGEQVDLLVLNQLQQACCVRPYKRSSITHEQELIVTDESAEEIIVAEIPTAHPAFEQLVAGVVDWKIVVDVVINSSGIGIEGQKIVLWNDLRATLNQFGGVYKAVVTEYQGTNPALIGRKYLSLHLDRKLLTFSKLASWLDSYPPGVQAPGLVKTLRTVHWQLDVVEAAKHGFRGSLAIGLLVAIPFEIADEWLKEEPCVSAAVAGVLFELGQGGIAAAIGVMAVPAIGTVLGGVGIVATAGGLLVGVVAGALLNYLSSDMKASLKDAVRKWVLTSFGGEHSYGLPEYPGGAEPWKEFGIDELVYRLSEPFELVYPNPKHIKRAKKKRDRRIQKEKERKKKLLAHGRLPAPGPAEEEGGEGPTLPAPDLTGSGIESGMLS